MRVQLRFDSLPGPDGARLIEVEDLFGHSVSVGEWTKDGGDGDALLLLDLADGPTAEREAAIKGFVAVWDENEANVTLALNVSRLGQVLDELLAARERLRKVGL